MPGAIDVVMEDDGFETVLTPSVAKPPSVSELVGGVEGMVLNIACKASCLQDLLADRLGCVPPSNFKHPVPGDSLDVLPIPQRLENVQDLLVQLSQQLGEIADAAKESL